jgi:hypothetical protein
MRVQWCGRGPSTPPELHVCEALDDSLAKDDKLQNVNRVIDDFS